MDLQPMKIIARALLLFAIAAPAWAQTPAPPYTYGPTVGTSSAQVLPANPSRKKLLFFNPNNTAKVAVCTPLSRLNSGAITCAVNGAGSITLLPYGSFSIESGAPGNQGLQMGSSWNAISDTPSSGLTILEFE